MVSPPLFTWYLLGRPELLSLEPGLLFLKICHNDSMSNTPHPFMRISNLKYRTHLYVDGIQTEGGRHWSPLTSDQIRGLLSHHDGGGVQVAADYAGHDARVNYPQSLQSENLLTANT